MRADQIVQIRGRGIRLYRGVGQIRFVTDPPHHHWHLMRFQEFDLLGVPAGEYVLVHRVNESRLIQELRYDNNAASLRVRIAWPHGPHRTPSVRVLRSCPGSERC
jgi:hypothetical protein